MWRLWPDEQPKKDTRMNDKEMRLALSPQGYSPPLQGAVAELAPRKLGIETREGCRAPKQAEPARLQSRACERVALYRKTEIARKQLPFMDEEAFRSLLRSEFGVESRKDMTIRQLSRLVQLFAARFGVTYTAKRTHRPTRHGRPDFIEITDSMPYASEKRQILAIWRKLGYSMTSLDVRVRRAFGVGCFVWMTDREQIGVLLSDLQRREKAFEKRQRAAARATEGGASRSGPRAARAAAGIDSSDAND